MTAGCKRCGEEIGSGPVYVLDVIRYPYNPEWQIERLDAGRFCSARCLATYVAEVSW